jgi:hypothetical protein
MLLQAKNGTHPAGLQSQKYPRSKLIIKTLHNVA